MEQDIISNYNCPVKNEYCQIHSISYRGKCPYCDKGIEPKHKEVKDIKINKIIPERKMCNRCKKEKHISKFCLNRNNHDDHDNFCKICRSEIGKSYRERKKGKQA